MFKKVISTVAIAALAFAPALSLAHGTTEPTADEGWYNMMPHHGTWGTMGGFALWGWFFFLCWIGLIVIEALVIVWLWQKVTKKK